MEEAQNYPFYSYFVSGLIHYLADQNFYSLEQNWSLVLYLCIYKIILILNMGENKASNSTQTAF